MDCNGVEDFGCSMQNMGSWVGNFLNVAGEPLTSLLFIFLIVTSILIMGYAMKRILE